MQASYLFLLVLGVVRAGPVAETPGEGGSASSEGDVYINVYGVNPYDLAYELGTFHGPPNFFTQSYISVADILQRPLLILAHTGAAKDAVTVYYARNGLNSVYEYQAFAPLVEHLKTTGASSGLIFHPKSIYTRRFFDLNIEDFVLPNEYFVGQFLKDVQIPTVPLLYIAPREDFIKNHFSGLSLFAKFGVYKDQVEPLPVYPHSYEHYFQHIKNHQFVPTQLTVKSTPVTLEETEKVQ